jgi:hypothetical protein
VSHRQGRRSDENTLPPAAMTGEDETFMLNGVAVLNFQIFIRKARRGSDILGIRLPVARIKSRRMELPGRLASDHQPFAITAAFGPLLAQIARHRGSRPNQLT